MKYRTVIVAGGRGLIGARLCQEFLAYGARVVSIDSGLFGSSPLLLKNLNAPNYEDILAPASEGQMLSASIGNIERPSLIINCAGPARPTYFLRYPVETANSLVDTSQYLLGLAASCNASYILASSSEIYGDSDHQPLHEDYFGSVPLHSLRSSYAEAKRFGETLAYVYSRQLNARVRILRLFNVYGPEYSDDDDRVIPAFVGAAKPGGTMHIHGTGKQERSFCFLDDVIAAFLAASELQDPLFLCVNVGNPNEPISINNLAELVRRMAGVPIEFVRDPSRGGDIRRRIPDIQRAMKVLGWRPRVGLEEGLRRIGGVMHRKGRNQYGGGCGA